MIIGVPKEIKNNENRVALTPGAASQLIAAGHRVIVEKDAGTGSGFENEDYVSVGAEISEQAEAVWEAAEMVMKVKEPLPEELRRGRGLPDQRGAQAASVPEEVHVRHGHAREVR